MSIAVTVGVVTYPITGPKQDEQGPDGYFGAFKTQVGDGSGGLLVINFEWQAFQSSKARWFLIRDCALWGIAGGITAELNQAGSFFGADEVPMINQPLVAGPTGSRAGASYDGKPRLHILAEDATIGLIARARTVNVNTEGFSAWIFGEYYEKASLGYRAPLIRW